MLNCGARIDLTKFWFLQEGQKIEVLLVDSYRPIHHSNVLCGNRSSHLTPDC
jgi:hypothetical protein